MAAAGVDLAVISRRLGHASTKTTLEIYYHVTKKQRQKDAEILDAVTVLA